MVVNTSPAVTVVSTDDIAERAYTIYVDRGRTHGFDREDWLRAERELTTARRDPVERPATKARGQRKSG